MDSVCRRRFLPEEIADVMLQRTIPRQLRQTSSIFKRTCLRDGSVMESRCLLLQEDMTVRPMWRFNTIVQETTAGAVSDGASISVIFRERLSTEYRFFGPPLEPHKNPTTTPKVSTFC